MIPNEKYFSSVVRVYSEILLVDFDKRSYLYLQLLGVKETVSLGSVTILIAAACLGPIS